MLPFLLLLFGLILSGINRSAFHGPRCCARAYTAGGRGELSRLESSSIAHAPRTPRRRKCRGRCGGENLPRCDARQECTNHPTPIPAAAAAAIAWRPWRSIPLCEGGTAPIGGDR